MPEGSKKPPGSLFACRVVVTGRVQGVFFRAGAKEAADKFGVAGWVRNLSDGSVEAHIEHEDPAMLDAMLAWLREGPPGARVEEVKVEAAKAEGSGSFEIRGVW